MTPTSQTTKADAASRRTKVVPADPIKYRLIPADQLEVVNDALIPADLMVMRQDNGAFSLYRIERGAIDAAHERNYDRYIRVGGSHADLGAAWVAAMRWLTRRNKQATL
jgi:hypothetical protein